MSLPPIPDIRSNGTKVSESQENQFFIPIGLALECPFCGNSRLLMLDSGDAFRVSCNDCRCNGPSGSNPAEALDRWNWLGHR